MNENREQFISDEELKRIREKKLKEYMKVKERTEEMSNEPIHVTDASFEDFVNKNPLVLIDFWAAWCGPCRVLAPTIEELAEDYYGKVLVGKLNVDENPQAAERFQVFSIPTVLIIKNGEEVDRIVGCVPKEYFETALKKYLG